MAEKLNFMVFKAVFLFEVLIQQSHWKKNLKKLKITKKSKMAAQKWKKYMAASSIEGF